MNRRKAAQLLAAMLLPYIAAAQTPSVAGDKLQFDVASVKLNKSGDPGTANVSMGPGSAFVPTGGFFRAVSYPLYTYLAFAYKILPNQDLLLRSQLPDWVTTEHFDIEARAAGNPDKDQLRLMMRALLADRFRLAIHSETREVPVLALVPAKPGKTGPRIRPHANDPPCIPNPPPDQIDARFPSLCGGIVIMPHPPVFMNKYGARNVTMGFIANSFKGMGHLDRPVIDQTGLEGNFDFALEWVPEVNGPGSAASAAQSEPSGATFLQALSEQLGLKLESRKGSVDVLVLDHVEHPSGN